MSIASAYLRMINEAKKLDKVNHKELEKDFDDREDKDIDNDGDTDDSDEYLHNRRKAVKKAAKESIQIDPDNGDVSKKKDSKKSKKGEEEKVDMNENAEKLEPEAKGEKEFADKHTVDVVDRPDATKQDGAEKVKPAPARPGDNKQSDKLKTFKDIRK